MSQELFLVFLGVHDKLRVAPDAWEYLSARDLAQLPVLSRTIREKLKRVEYTKCRDGRDYRVPFPGFPGLLSTPADLRIGSGLFQHQLASLEAMIRFENSDRCFDSLRGGVLGDAPGLGKTITMLALVASTAGTRPNMPPEFWDQSYVDEGWKNLRRSEAYRESIVKALKPIRLWAETSSGCYERYKELRKYVSPPFPDDRLQTIRDFEIYVNKSLRQFVPQSELELFRNNLCTLKAGLDKRNRKLFCSEKGRRLAWERNLLPSSATLIVVPDALLEHWFQQIHMHLNLTPFADEKENQDGGEDRGIRGVVYLDGIGDLADARMPLKEVSLEAQVLPLWELSKHLMVITTFSRCKREFQKEVKAGRMKGVPTVNGKKRSRDAVEGHLGNHSPLLQMRWLRLVVDEGHELGTYDAGNDVTHFINQIAAERRWVMSGTPTTGDEDSADYSAKALDQLQRLLFFLRHPEYGNLPSPSGGRDSPSPYLIDSSDDSGDENDTKRRAEAKAKWITRAKEPFLAKMEEGRQELLRVLRGVMVMHRKEDIHLPRPVFQQAEVEVAVPDEVQIEIRAISASSAAVSNQQRVQAQIELLNEYLKTDEFQSRVDQAQGKHIVQAIRNAQQALQERGGHLEAEGGLSSVIAEYENMDTKIDRRPIKAVVYSSEKNNLLSVTEHLYKELSAENVAEMYDGGDGSAELSRFRNGFKECRQCPVCKSYNDFGGKGIGADRCSNILLEVTSQSAPGTRFLIEPERICRAVGIGEPGGNVNSNRLGGEGLSNYWLHRKQWRVGDVLEVDIRDPHPLLPSRESQETWLEHGSEKCDPIGTVTKLFGTRLVLWAITMGWYRRSHSGETRQIPGMWSISQPHEMVPGTQNFRGTN